MADPQSPRIVAKKDDPGRNEKQPWAAPTGALTAKAFDADPEWIVIGALAGAAAGTLIARNASTKQCAYAKGDRTY